MVLPALTTLHYSFEAIVSVQARSCPLLLLGASKCTAPRSGGDCGGESAMVRAEASLIRSSIRFNAALDRRPSPIVTKHIAGTLLWNASDLTLALSSTPAGVSLALWCATAALQPPHRLQHYRSSCHHCARRRLLGPPTARIQPRVYPPVLHNAHVRRNKVGAAQARTPVRRHLLNEKHRLARASGGIEAG